MNQRRVNWKNLIGAMERAKRVVQMKNALLPSFTTQREHAVKPAKSSICREMENQEDICLEGTIIQDVEGEDKYRTEEQLTLVSAPKRPQCLHRG